MGKVLQVRDLAIGYGQEVLLDEIAFDVQRGEVFAVLGGSGCGKSTLLRTLIGLQPPLQGRVHFTGIGPPARAMEPPSFGVLFQSSALFGSSTLLQNVLLPLQKWTDLPLEAATAVALGRLRLVGLEPFAHHLPAEVSGGMRKRAGIARALALDPPILFFDEPSAGLDPVTAAELDELIMTLSKGLAVTIVVEGSLSFLGLGVPPPTSSWGSMIAEGRESLEVAPRLAFLPAIAMFLTVLSFNLVGDTLRALTDPRQGAL